MSVKFLMLIGLSVLLIGLFPLMLDQPDKSFVKELLVIGLLAFASVGVLACFRLHTLISSDFIQVSLKPFGKAKIPLAEVVAIDTVHYRPVRDFGGWGIRRGLGGVCYTIQGERALKLTLSDGRIFFIGSGDVEDLAMNLKKEAATLST